MTTLEARWFWPLKNKKPLPPDEFSNSTPETRTDFYFSTKVGNVGVKWRENNIEIKSRIKTAQGYKVSRKLSHLSLWDKQVMYENIDPGTLGDQWTAVKKTRWSTDVNGFISMEFAQVDIGKERFISLCVESERTNQRTAQLMEEIVKEYAKSGWDSKKYPLNSKSAGDYPDLIVRLKV